MITSKISMLIMALSLYEDKFYGRKNLTTETIGSFILGLLIFSIIIIIISLIGLFFERTVDPPKPKGKYVLLLLSGILLFVLSIISLTVL